MQSVPHLLALQSASLLQELFENELYPSFQDPLGNYFYSSLRDSRHPHQRSSSPQQDDRIINVLQEFSSTFQDLDPKVNKAMPIEQELCQNIEKDIICEKRQSDVRMEIVQEGINGDGDSLECSDDQIFRKRGCKQCQLNIESMLAFASIQNQVLSQQQLLQQNYQKIGKEKSSLQEKKKGEERKCVQLKQKKAKKRGIKKRERQQGWALSDCDSGKSEYQPVSRNKKRRRGNDKNIQKKSDNSLNYQDMIGSSEKLQVKKGCTCKKTKCSKKYCECFHSGAKCSQSCRCLECINH